MTSVQIFVELQVAMITTMTPANIIMLLSPAQSYCDSTCLFVDKKQLQGSELCDLTLQFSCTNRAVMSLKGVCKECTYVLGTVSECTHVLGTVSAIL